VGRSQNGGIQWSQAGDRIAYGSTRRNGKDRDIYVMNPHDRASDHLLLQVEGGGWGVLAWSPDDARLAVSQLVSANESYIWLLDAKSGARTLLTPKGGADTVAYGGAEF